MICYCYSTYLYLEAILFRVKQGNIVTGQIILAIPGGLSYWSMLIFASTAWKKREVQ